MALGNRIRNRIAKIAGVDLESLYYLVKKMEIASYRAVRDSQKVSGMVLYDYVNEIKGYIGMPQESNQ